MQTVITCYEVKLLHNALDVVKPPEVISIVGSTSRPRLTTVIGRIVYSELGPSRKTKFKQY